MMSKRTSLGKTTRPVLAGILPRARLFELFDAGRQSPVLWVSGPPGSGKTTAGRATRRWVKARVTRFGLTIFTSRNLQLR